MRNLSIPAKAALVGFLVLAVLAILSSVAKAQGVCGPAAAAMESLATKYGETMIFSGDTGNGSQIVVTVNSDTGTWSVLTLQSGMACLRASGQSFTSAPVKPNA